MKAIFIGVLLLTSGLALGNECKIICDEVGYRLSPHFFNGSNKCEIILDCHKADWNANGQCVRTQESVDRPNVQINCDKLDPNLVDLDSAMV